MFFLFQQAKFGQKFEFRCNEGDRKPFPPTLKNADLSRDFPTVICPPAYVWSRCNGICARFTGQDVTQAGHRPLHLLRP